MARPVLTICTRCESGDELIERVKRLRRERALRDVFKVEDVRCLGVCEPCVIQLEGKKRSTYLRSRVHPKHDAERVVEAARAYAALEPGQELRDREMPGDHED